jgi:transglutaminase-like putative cysteine protease
VIGKNAHAWPELWFDGIGWVAFEPTPGRGAPGAESYTGVPAQQDESGTGGGDGSGADPLPGPTPTAPPTVVQNDSPAVTTTTIPGDAVPDTPADAGIPSDPDLNIEPVPVGSGDDDGSGGFPWTPILVISLVVLVLGAPAIIRRLLRLRSRVHGPRDQIAAAWQRACAAASDVGVVGSPAMTATEWATATAAVMPVAARPMASLAEVVDLVSFARPDELDVERRGTFGDSIADDCELWATQIDKITTDTMTATQRVERYFTALR